MKYYETHYDDYLFSSEKFNIHPELVEKINRFPKKIQNMKSLIVYGPPGSGKYTQVLKILKKYSPSELKYDKKMKVVTEKLQYSYRISDIHYEIDMSLLGCNSKMLWHEIFFQIVDIISVKQEKIGIILCKNFHFIHAELLEIFYSYMQQYNYNESNIKIKFIIMTEHLSFIPEQIINSTQLIQVKRPTKEMYEKLTLFTNTQAHNNDTDVHQFMKKIIHIKSNSINESKFEKTKNITKSISPDGVVNMKELQSFELITKQEDIPKEIFNIVCDNIIENILNKNSLSFTTFRDVLYDILTYNLDVTECLYNILETLIKNKHLKSTDISDILRRSFSFLKYYNNNYRPIYHLESIMFYIINKLHNIQ
jgi:hypothetical protein